LVAASLSSVRKKEMNEKMKQSRHDIDVTIRGIGNPAVFSIRLLHCQPTKEMKSHSHFSDPPPPTKNERKQPFNFFKEHHNKVSDSIVDLLHWG
jgi:hypothetical protein